MLYDLIIVGGGAAGLVCAIETIRKNKNAAVAVIERMPRVGKKILVTGNGKCNLSNTGVSPDKYNNPFVTDILKKYDAKAVCGFFESLGLMLREDEEGRVYPVSSGASSVLDALRFECEKAGAHIICDTSVTSAKKDGGFLVINNGAFKCKKLVLATGGKSAKVHGSDGSGYALARQLGHSVTPLYPALVPLLSIDPLLKSLKGVRQGGVTLRLSGGFERENGEIQFNEDGVSGIIAMEMGAKVNERRAKGQQTILTIDLLPPAIYGECLGFLLKAKKIKGSLPLDEFLTGIFRKALGIAVIKKSGLYSSKRKISSLSDGEIEKIEKTIHNFEIEITGTKSFDFSQVTRGGVCTDEIDPVTLESKICKGLYFAGEIMDVDGLCGGFNLHWAFATGMVNGRG